MKAAYSYVTAAEDFSVSVSTLRRAVKAGKIRTRQVNGLVRLCPEDLQREFGYEPLPRDPSPATRAMIRGLLA